MTYYERLGVRTSATPAEIRDAYRAAARRAHPDRHGEASSAQMATINEAYRVLSDPARRRRYDDQLGDALDDRAIPHAETVGERDWSVGDVIPTEYHEPGRFPWRFMAVMASIGIVVVVIGVILYEPPPSLRIDNVLRPGDCVTLSATYEAAEASCDGPHDAVLHVLVPIDQTCPAGTESFRDRQGMGTACVVRMTTTS